MKIFITLLTIITIATFSFSQPKISIDKSEINLGITYAGMKKKGAIVIKNIGNDTLRIFSVHTSCGCAAVKQPKLILPPNDSDFIEVEFNTAGYRGYVEKHLSIATNDPASQNISMKIITEVKEELKPIYGSSLVWFGNMAVGDISERSLVLVNTSERTIKIKKLSASSPSIKTDLIKNTVRPNDTIDIKITLKADKVGYTSETVTIETDSKFQPSMEARISFIGKKD